VLGIFTDIVVGLHLVCFAVGLGIAFYADMRFARRLFLPVRASDIRELEKVHRFIGAALIFLWVTGLGLLYIRTGFDPDAFSPKLVLKLLVVSLLSANAILLGKLALPLIRIAEGRSISVLPFRHRLILLTLAAVSVFCWISGLALGSSATLKVQAFDVLFPLFTGLFAFMMAGAVAVAFSGPHCRATCRSSAHGSARSGSCRNPPACGRRANSLSCV
jgi:hypothetical protein